MKKNMLSVVLGVLVIGQAIWSIRLVAKAKNYGREASILQTQLYIANSESALYRSFAVKEMANVVERNDAVLIPRIQELRRAGKQAEADKVVGIGASNRCFLDLLSHKPGDHLKDLDQLQAPYVKN